MCGIIHKFWVDWNKISSQISQICPIFILFDQYVNTEEIINTQILGNPMALGSWTSEFLPSFDSTWPFTKEQLISRSLGLKLLQKLV